MTTTAASLIAMMRLHLQEDATLSTGLWTSPELTQYISDADREFLLMTGAVKSTATITALQSVSVYSEPSDSIDVERVAFNNKKLYPVSRSDLNHQDPSWRADTGNPKRYHRDLPPKQFEVWPKPAAVGSGNLTVFYNKLPSALTDPPSAQTITTPDAFARYVMYRALEKAWAKEGDGQDVERAAYCGMRFTRGVALARRLIYGDDVPMEAKR